MIIMVILYSTYSIDFWEEKNYQIPDVPAQCASSKAAKACRPLPVASSVLHGATSPLDPLHWSDKPAQYQRSLIDDQEIDHINSGGADRLFQWGWQVRSGPCNIVASTACPSLVHFLFGFSHCIDMDKTSLQ